MRKQEGKNELRKKVQRKFVWGTSDFWLHALLSMAYFGRLKHLKIARIVLFVFFLALNWFYLTQKPYFHLLHYLLLLAWMLFGLEKCWHNQIHGRVGYLFKLLKDAICKSKFLMDLD